MIRGVLDIAETEPPSDGYVLVYSTARGRAAWKAITGAALSGFVAGQVAFGAAAGGLTTDAGLTYAAASGLATSLPITSTVATGTAPLVVASTTLVANLNAALLGGATFAAPGPIGSGTPGTGAFTTLTASDTTAASTNSAAAVVIGAGAGGIGGGSAQFGSASARWGITATALTWYNAGSTSGAIAGADNSESRTAIQIDKPTTSSVKLSLVPAAGASDYVLVGTSTALNGTDRLQVAGSVTLQGSSLPTLTVNNTTTASSSWAFKHLANGDLQIVQPSQNTWITLTHATGKLTSIGPVLISDGTASTSNITGALVVTGGIASSGNSYFSGSTISFTSGNASSSTTTGNVVVSGGIGVGGAANIGGALSLTGSASHNIKRNVAVQFTSDGTAAGVVGGGLFAQTAGNLSLYGGTTAANNLNVLASGRVTVGSLTDDGVSPFQVNGALAATSIKLGAGTTLSTYTESTWTPTVQGSTTAGANTYTAQVGRYFRIGNKIFAEFTIQMSVKDAAMAGNIQIGGLPINVKSLSNYQPVANVSVYQGVTLPANTQLAGYAASATGYVGLFTCGSGVNISGLTVASITASFFVSGTIVYEV